MTPFHKPDSQKNRDYLAHRADRALHPSKLSPSAKRSDNMRKKLARGIAEQPFKKSCHNCTKNCGFTISGCAERSAKQRCLKCGQYVMYRYDPDVPFRFCDDCKPVLDNQ